MPPVGFGALPAILANAMKEFIQNRVPKYVVYFIGLPTSGFTGLALLAPLTRGAHDGGLLGMVTGLLAGQLLFSLWLLDFKWYFGMMAGLLIGIVTVWAAYSIIGLLSYSPDGISLKQPAIITAMAPKDAYGYPQEEKVLRWIFFIVFLSLSVLLWESANRIGKYGRSTE